MDPKEDPWATPRVVDLFGVGPISALIQLVGKKGGGSLSFWAVLSTGLSGIDQNIGCYDISGVAANAATLL